MWVYASEMANCVKFVRGSAISVRITDGLKDLGHANQQRVLTLNTAPTKKTHHAPPQHQTDNQAPLLARPDGQYQDKYAAAYLPSV